MQSRMPLTRRSFLGNTTAAAVGAASSSSIFDSTGFAQEEGARVVRPRPTGPVGKIGQTFPDQRRKYTDNKSGKVVWQMTDTQGRYNHVPYYSSAHGTPDGKWLIFSSDRAGEEAGRFNFYKMNLLTGESVQLTESGIVQHDACDLAPNGKDFYYFEEGNVLHCVDLDSLKVREVGKLPESVQPPPHSISVSRDNRFLVSARLLEKKRVLGYEYPPYVVDSAMFIIDLHTGEHRSLFRTTQPLGHAAYSPAQNELILYDHHGPWHLVHRPWLIKTDGTGNRQIFPNTIGESLGHEFWSVDGKSIYSVNSGGRFFPQGLWRCDVDGSNERPCLAGPTIAHCTANSQDDMFAADETYTHSDNLWYSRKGSTEAKVLCQMTDWFKQSPSGKYNPTDFHPHSRFMPGDKAVSFTNGGQIYMVEV
jgi:hypothetical protein